ncbi:MAG: type II toxin-antitoxin system death-on-curing family toxin [Bacteroidota bacterium]
MATQFIPDSFVLQIHQDLLNRYGGRPGIRDRNLLAFALAQPQMTAGRKMVHRTIFEKAAAYGFHICRNHQFVDGNKRVALVLTDIFLDRNGWTLSASEQEAYGMMMDLATGKTTKRRLADWLKQHTRRSSR